MGGIKQRKLFYHPAWGGTYVVANGREQIKRWDWMQDVTGNPHHEIENSRNETEYLKRKRFKLIESYRDKRVKL